MSSNRPYIAERSPSGSGFHIFVPGEHYVGHFTVPVPTSTKEKPKLTAAEAKVEQQKNADELAEKYTALRGPERNVFERYAAEYERGRPHGH